MCRLPPVVCSWLWETNAAQVATAIEEEEEEVLQPVFGSHDPVAGVVSAPISDCVSSPCSSLSLSLSRHVTQPGAAADARFFLVFSPVSICKRGDQESQV